MTNSATSLTIGVTHAGQGADWLVQACLKQGYAVVQVPLTQFAAVPDQELVRGQVARLPPASWLVISSVQGAASLAQLFAPSELVAFRVVAVGEATAKRLRHLGFPINFVPSEASGAVLGRELPAHAGEVVLHLTSDRAKEDLALALAERGLLYQRLTLYQTRLSIPSAAELEALLAADLVTLASSSAAEALACCCRGPLPAVAVMGQQTARTARALGFGQVMVASRPALAELLQVVTDYFRAAHRE